MKRLVVVFSVMLSVLLLTMGLVFPITAYGVKDDTKNIVLHFGGIEKEDEILLVNAGETLNLSKYEIEGFELKVYDDSMTQVNKNYVVSKDAVLNLIYSGVEPTNPFEDKARIIVIAGQSNAAGVGRYNCLKDTVPAEYFEKLENGFDNVLMSGYSHDISIEEIIREYVKTDCVLDCASQIRDERIYTGNKQTAINNIKSIISSNSKDNVSAIYTKNGTTSQSVAEYAYNSVKLYPTINGFQKVQLHQESYMQATDVAGSFGPELLIAERLSEAFPNETVYIVKAAFGGVSLDFDFKSPSAEDPVYFGESRDYLQAGWMYDKLIDSVSWAVDYLKGQGKIPSIEAFMWLQGESDATATSLVEAYGAKFEALISDFKGEFSDSISKSFSVYDAGLYTGVGLMFPLASDINNVKKSFVGDNYFYIDVNSLSATTNYEPYNSADCAHYDATSYINISRALADAYIKKVNPFYTTDTLVITGANEMTISLKNGNVYLPNVTVKYNGKVVKPTFYFESSNNNKVNVKRDGKLVPQAEGSSTIKIIACYNETFAFKFVNVKIVK